MSVHCVTPNCTREVFFDDRWCIQHYGVFPHKCEMPTCTINVIYDDEPYCFTHSPDSGSSQTGYSAYRKHHQIAS